MHALKAFVLAHWPLRALALLVLRRKIFMDEFVYKLGDYRDFKASVAGWRAFTSKTPADPKKPGVLLVAGAKMNTQWNELWVTLAAAYQYHGHKVFVLTSRNEPVQNLFYKLFGIQTIFLQDWQAEPVRHDETLYAEVDALQSFFDFKEYEYADAPLGKMALSTYSRLRASGIMDVEAPGARAESRDWIVKIHETRLRAERLFDRHGIGIVYLTEIFMEEYGGIYYGALRTGRNVIRTAGTVRDNAVVIQHLTPGSDRTHFSAITPKSWQRILDEVDVARIEHDLAANFADRYGDKWGLSKRNQPNTKIVAIKEARQTLGVAEGRKIAVVYSHILYDTLFFNGEDLFANYAEWLVETVKAACANPEVDWFIKVHPSNLWRGELEYYHGGVFEEVRLIKEHVGELPAHVHMVFPDTPLSPYTWMQVADYGITVRGTTGIEMGALGRTVVTAGTGRYEWIGFTVNPQSKQEYLDTLAKLQDVPDPTAEQHRLGKLFAYATFCMKPYTLYSLKPAVRNGRSSIFSSDDLVYLGDFPEPLREVPQDIERVYRWSLLRDEVDLLSGWPDQVPLGSVPSSHPTDEGAVVSSR
ncbi:MAG: hypothetical protein JJ969_05505 [Rhizobiaceae bacterium]|nr:hypothetical protein [Rhizobiaceae bacterium]